MDAPKGERVCQKGWGVKKYPERGKCCRRAVTTVELSPCMGQDPPHPPPVGVGLRGVMRCVRDRAA